MNTAIEKTRLIATYSRVSTPNQEEEQTIQIQLNTLREFAQKNGWTIVREYTDEGWSGDLLARPALDQLRQDAKEKIWDAVLIYDPDRLARRYSYQELVMDELREAGIEIIFVTVPSPKNSEEKILHGVRGLFAEYERAKISERFRLGKIRKVKEGHILVSEALYGYRYIPKQDKTHGYYEINESEARVVKMIFSWIADESLNIRKVVRRLQELGIKPRKSKRGVWNTSTLTNMLRNRAYIGEARWGSTYAIIPENPIKKEGYRKIRKSSRKIKPEEEWIASKIPVPAIIDKELFTRAREQLKINSSLCSRNTKYEYLLGGKINCTCGKTRSGAGPQHGKHLYYRCNDRIYSFPLPPTCKEGGVNARIADQLVWEKIAKLMSSPKLLLSQVNRWMKSRRDKAESLIGDMGSIEKEIAKLKAQEDRYNKAYGDGIFTMGQLKNYITPIRERVASLEFQIARVQQEENQIGPASVPNENEIWAFAKRAAEELYSLSFETKRAIIRKVIEKIVAAQEKLEVYGYLPITPNHVAFTTINRHRRAPKRR